MPYLYKNSYVYYMYNTIVNPITGRAVNVNGRTGKMILKQYVNQLGGGTGETSRRPPPNHRQRTFRKIPRTDPRLMGSLLPAGYHQRDLMEVTGQGQDNDTIRRVFQHHEPIPQHHGPTPQLAHWQLHPGVSIVRIEKGDPTDYQVGPAQGGIQFDDHVLPLYQLKHQPVDAADELERAHGELHNFVADTLLTLLQQERATMQSCPRCVGGRANNAYALKGDILNLINYNAELVKRGVTGRASQSVDWNTFPNIISVVGSTSAELDGFRELQDRVNNLGAMNKYFTE